MLDSVNTTTYNESILIINGYVGVGWNSSAVRQQCVCGMKFYSNNLNVLAAALHPTQCVSSTLSKTSAVLRNVKFFYTNSSNTSFASKPYLL